MSENATPVKVTILEKDYVVACPEPECEALYQSARRLDQKMKEIRSNGNIVGLDRIAVMAALNITHELLRQEAKSSDLDRTVSDRIRVLQDKVDHALAGE